MIGKIKHFIVALIGGLTVGAVVQASVMPWTTKAMRIQATTSTVAKVPGIVTNDFTIRFLTGTFPTNLVLGLTPSVTNLAQYDAGDGVWQGFTSRTITLATASSYISFRGSWTNSSRTYQALFSETFNSSAYTCQTEGAFSNKPVSANAYRDMFVNAKAIVSFTTNPIPNLSGAPGSAMYYQTFYGMGNLTSLPEGFMDMSKIVGPPAGSMLYYACYGVSNVTTLPANFMYTVGVTGTPIGNMYSGALYNMSGVTSLPTGCLDTRGLTGPPAGNMLYQVLRNTASLTSLPVGCLDLSGLSGPPASFMLNTACNGMASLVTGDFYLSSNITFAATNIATSLSTAFANMPKWTGTVYWGTNIIYEAITNPASDANTFQNSTNVPGFYTIMGSNWK